MKTQICKTCNIEKPFDTGFYKNQYGRDTTCKDCRKLQQKQRRKQRKSNYAVANDNELAFVEACKLNGIFAQPTAELRNYTFSDVVAWGCICIEFKYPQIYGPNDTHKWAFSTKQARERFPVDLVVLASKFYGETAYHLFSPLHPVFFGKGNKRRLAITYTHNSNINVARYEKRYGTKLLTREIMAFTQDNWHLIEKLRLEKAQALKQQARKAAA